MKTSIKGLFVIMAVVMSFVAVQSVCAETSTVTGMIDEISTRPNMIVVDGTEVCGVRINYLANQYNIVLDEGIYVSVDVYEYECPRYDTTKLIAYRITVDNVTVQLRDPQ